MTLCIAMLAAPLSGAAPADDEPTTAPATQPSKEQVLGEAYKLHPKEIEQFVQLLQANAHLFRQVDVGTEVGRARWRTIILNDSGERLDCVRFRTPAGEARDMHWSFVVPKGEIEMWYICPVEGEMAGFRKFERSNADEWAHVDAPPGAVLFQQSLGRGSFKPDAEYLLWFKFKKKKPVEMDLAINLVDAPPTDMSAAEALGMKKADVD
jgi:hypothetical protein